MRARASIIRVWRVTVLVLGLMFLAPAARPEFAGHGGPVRALAVAGGEIVSGGFDQSAIRWNVARQDAIQVLRHHTGSVNAVLVLPDGRIVTAGEDATIAIWRSGATAPERVLRGHEGQVVALAARDGMLASAGWDRSVRLWSLDDGAARGRIDGLQANPAAVAFAPDGMLVVAGVGGWLVYDPATQARLREIGIDGAPQTALVFGPEGLLATAGADAIIRIFRYRDGALVNEVQPGRAPLVTLVATAELIFAGGLDSVVPVVRWRDGAVVRRINARRGPIWALALLPGGATLLTGGADATIRRWSIATGEEEGADPSRPLGDPREFVAASDPGAAVFRACAACHTLTADGGNRAGPTLHGLFGRRIGTVPGFAYSDALRDGDIIWTAETVARLFELGPDVYTPGTRMPVQRIRDAEERAALIRFLERETAPR